MPEDYPTKMFRFHWVAHIHKQNRIDEAESKSAHKTAVLLAGGVHMGDGGSGCVPFDVTLAFPFLCFHCCRAAPSLPLRGFNMLPRRDLSPYPVFCARTRYIRGHFPARERMRGMHTGSREVNCFAAKIKKEKSAGVHCIFVRPMKKGWRALTRAREAVRPAWCAGDRP